jgi:hypothetical protein
VRRLIATLVAVATLGTSCVEGPFEPFAPERDQPPLRFVGGAAPNTPFVFLAGVVQNDSIVRLDVRLRNAPRVSAIVFELALEGNVAVIDSILPGTFFSPVSQVPLVNAAVSPDDSTRWIGVATVPNLSTVSAGSGTIATLVVRRTRQQPFDIAVAFDSTTSRAYGADGLPVVMNWTRGRLIHVPRTATSSLASATPSPIP